MTDSLAEKTSSEPSKVHRLDSLQSETWCLLDGEGGYASGNVALLPTSPAEGLLVKSTQPPVGRFLLLARLEEVVRYEGREIPLSTQRYLPDVVAPHGYRHLLTFEQHPFPTWTFDLGGWRLERQIFNLRGRSLVGVAYRLIGAERPVWLQIRPLLAFRRIHDITIENTAANGSATPSADGQILSFALYPGLPELHLSSSLAWQEQRCWYRNFHYPLASPLLQHEDLLSPGTFSGELPADGTPRVLLAATEPADHRVWQGFRQQELDRREQEVARFPARGEGELDPLICVGSDFLGYRADEGAGILPHLPDATHDGRTSLIGLRGLALIPGKYDVARQILATLAEEYAKGLIPSVHQEWGGGGDVSGYDTLLWFPVAAYSYLLYTEDIQFIRSKLFWPLVEIGGQIQRGLPGLRMDRIDNLLVIGEDQRPHTWMNALYPDGQPVTLRLGKPVELNALWYNTCEALKEISHKLGRSDLMRSYRALGLRIRESFPVTFWNPRTRCLCDVVNDQVRDDSIRPNQLLALSLPFRLMEGDRAESILKVVERELLTPWGLRTLSPRSPGYAGSEEAGAAGLGGPHLRHQGSVYPWLLGPYISAYARLHAHEVGFGQQVRDWLAMCLAGDPTALPGHLRERYDGDEPHAPRGTRSSALNVAEISRAYVEEVLEYPAFNMRPAMGAFG